MRKSIDFFDYICNQKHKNMKVSTIIALTIAAAIVMGCRNSGNNKQDSANEPTVISYDDSTDAAQNNVIEDEIIACEADDLAKFLAGKSDAKYADLQKSDFYKNYSSSAQQTWDDLRKRTLNPITEWCKVNIPKFHNDTATLIYPFGGPDILFAMTFFPNKKDYVLMGLENPGGLCKPDQLSEDEIHQYLDSLTVSMRYLNKFGFFIAADMAKNFRNKDMDGTLHVVLYTLAMNGCTITSHRNIYIDDRGEVLDSDGTPKTHPFGWELTFRKPGDARTRSVKYIKMDLSDVMMKGKMEFPFFLNSVKNKTCYLKSASYLMQSEEFKVVRKLFLEQFDEILQDESGFAYGRLIKDYDVNLFGTYTRPLKVFKIFKQEDLKEALEGSTPLPFKIGYASQLNESVLMSCTRKSPNAPKQNTTTTNRTSNANSQQGIVYKVQFLVTWKKIPFSAPEFSGIDDVDVYVDNNNYKYTAGCFKTEAECQATLAKVRAKGYNDAFIVKFNNGKREK